MELVRYALIILVPGLFGALAYSIVDRWRTQIQVAPTLIIDLLTFIIMITGLYYFKGIYTMTSLIASFDCLSFTRKYALLSILIAILVGTGLGFLRKLFFWIRH